MPYSRNPRVIIAPKSRKPPELLPLTSTFDGIEAWHAAAMDIWSSESDREQWVVRKFAAALNGEELQACLHQEPATTAKLDAKQGIKASFYRPNNLPRRTSTTPDSK